MNQVMLKGDGTLLEGGKTAGADPLMYLGYQVVLEDGCTLRSLFRMLDRYPGYRKLNAFLPSYLEQCRNSPESGCVCDGFGFLEFSKNVEMIGFPGKPRVEIYNSFYGVGEGGEAVTLRSVPLENLLDMPVKLGRLKHIVFGDRVDVLAFETVFNLFELIDGILWELGFQGTLMACELRR